ncbi:MAG: hypothetical protein IPI53_01385 [Saprospiraceae bacterium]|nr:hypothetical protein [Saprospiraceae bacterium]
MNFVLAKILLFICVFSFTPLKEICKIPLLVLHYSNHLKENPAMSLAEFFDMHYLRGMVLDEDFEQDQQLPFKTMDFTTLSVFVLSEKKDILLPQRSLVKVYKNKLNAVYLFFKEELHLSGVFHPPRIS